MTISAVGILANFSQEIHHWTILETTISRTIFWTQIRVKFLLFHDFWYFCYFPWLFHDFPWPQIFPWLSLTFHDCGNPGLILLAPAVQHKAPHTSHESPSIRHYSRSEKQLNIPKQHELNASLRNSVASGRKTISIQSRLTEMQAIMLDRFRTIVDLKSGQLVQNNIFKTI